MIYAEMTSPVPGSVRVGVQEEISIRFFHPLAVRENINIRINGDLIVANGDVIHDDFIETKSVQSGNCWFYSIRHKSGMPPGYMFVEGWCTKECSTVNAFFFVIGTYHKAYIHEKDYVLKHGKPISHPYATVLKNGVIVGGGGNDNYIRIDDKKYIWPKNLNIENDKIFIRPNDDGYIAFCSSGNRTYLLWEPYHMHAYSITTKNHYIGQKWISAQYKNRSIYLPIDYRPQIPTDNFFFSMRSPELDFGDDNPDIYFVDDVEVWWNSKNMVIRSGVDPSLGIWEDEILWTSDDITQEIKSVKIIDREHLLVNDKFYINTIKPKLEVVR